MEPALARVILGQVAKGERPATLHLARIGRTVAFGRRDTIASGYREALRATHASGFRAMERLSGGRVAAHSEGTMVLALTSPETDPASSTSLRFRRAAELVRDAFRELGVDARIGQLPGEYCPGEWSVNGAGRLKLAGAGQRLVPGAAHLAFVVVASAAEAIRSVLGPVHAALGLEWDPSTAGAADDLVPGLTPARVEDSLISVFGAESDIRPVERDEPTASLAGTPADRFRPPRAAAGPGPAG